MVNAHPEAAYDFLPCVAEGRPWAVDFKAGHAGQEVLEAAYLPSARGGERIALPLGRTGLQSISIRHRR